MKHDTEVLHIGPQEYVATCSCGWVGTCKQHKKEPVPGRPFWSRIAALNATLGHLKEEGQPMVPAREQA